MIAMTRSSQVQQPAFAQVSDGELFACEGRAIIGMGASWTPYRSSSDVADEK
jgi:hypothetical protein